MKFYFKIFAKLIAVFAFIPIFTSTGLSDSSPDSPPMEERWTGKITGMAEGTWVLNTLKNKNAENELPIKGVVNMSLKSVSGGFGRGACEGTITGKIKDGILKSDFSGRGRISEGESDIFGGMTGTLTEKTGAGTYSFITPIGNYTGSWTLEKE